MIYLYVQVWNPKKTNMISIIHSAIMKDSNRVNRLSGNFIQNQECILQHNKYIKDVDRAV